MKQIIWPGVGEERRTRARDEGVGEERRTRARDEGVGEERRTRARDEGVETGGGEGSETGSVMEEEGKKNEG